MSDTRYFLVTDETIIDAIKQNDAQKIAAFEKAEAFANENKLGEPVFKRFGIFDTFIDGFKSSGSEIDRSLMVAPKNGIFRPKKIKGSEIAKSYSELWKEVKIDGKEIEEVLGWNRLSFFPSSPGFHALPKDNLFVFMMPAKVSELKGCNEITNIEYFNLFKSKDKVA